MEFILANYTERKMISARYAMTQEIKCIGYSEKHSKECSQRIRLTVFQCANFSRFVLPRRRAILLLSNHRGRNTLLEDQPGDHR